MWYLLLLIGLAASVSAADPPQEDSYQEKRFQYIVTNQNLHIDHLQHKLEELEEEFNNLTEEVDLKEIRHLKARISNLEEHHCADEQSECRGDVHECINNLLFCDGVNDCHDESDEDDDTCSLNITHVGSSYTGLATWSGCESLNPDHAVVTITASKRKEFFPAVVWLRATLSYELDEKEHNVNTIQLKGFYNFGSREIVLGHMKDQKPPYGVVCHFNLGDDDHANCEIVLDGGHVCAHFNAARY